MNKKYLPIVVILILIVGLYGAYRIYHHFTWRASTPATQTASSSGTGAQAMSSLKALVAKGVSQSCTYNTDKSQGTIYISSGKVRADVDTTVGSVATKAHMLMMNNTSYIWTDGKSTGFRMAYDPNATPVPGASPSTAQGGLDTNASMNYNCSAWVADSSKFTLPAGINFASFTMPSQAAPSGSGTGASSNSSQCSYCNALSGSDKTQCLAALNCK